MRIIVEIDKGDHISFTLGSYLGTGNLLALTILPTYYIYLSYLRIS